MSSSFCVSLFYPLLDMVELSEYIIVSRDVLLYLNSSIGTFTPLDAHGEVDLLMRYHFFFWCSSCFTTVVVHHARWVSHGIPSIDCWRVVWILRVGKVCKRTRNVGFFLEIYVCVFTVQIWEGNLSFVTTRMHIHIVVLLTQIAVVSCYKDSAASVCELARDGCPL